MASLRERAQNRIPQVQIQDYVDDFDHKVGHDDASVSTQNTVVASKDKVFMTVMAPGHSGSRPRQRRKL